MKTILYNGIIYTVEGEQWEKKPVNTLIINDTGKIKAVGNFDLKDDKIAENARLYDLHGKTVLPGFVDSHVHMPGDVYSKMFEFSIEGMQRKEIKEEIKNFVSSYPEQEIYFGSGFNVGMLDSKGDVICAEWIDEACSEKPIVIRSIDMHSRLLNTKAMDLLGINKDVTSERGYIHRFADGRLTGVFTDARDVVNIDPVHSNEEKLHAMELFISKMNAWGYTAIMSIAPNMDLSPETYLELEKKGKLSLRTNCSNILTPENPKKNFDELIRLKERISSKGTIVKFNTAKVIVDGVVEGKTAYLNEPYADESNPQGYRGKPCWNEEEFQTLVIELDKMGFQVHFHSVGDAATEMALDAIEKAINQNGSSDCRHVITHLQLVNEKDFKRFRRNGVIAAIQPFWHCKEPDWFDYVDKKVLGEKRAEKEYPAKKFLDECVVITSSGDFPVSAENNPFMGIQTGVTRNLVKNNSYGVSIYSADDPKYILGKDQRMPLKSMIESYTINGAYQLFRENEIGSIVQGKYADLIVLDKDPFNMSPTEIESIKVTATIFNGEVVYGEL